MSRQIVSNQGELTQIIGDLFTTDSRNLYRTLFFLEFASPEWLQQYAQNAELKYIPPNANADRADQISALLGQEHRILAHALHDPMDVGLLAALAGTLSIGGVLIIALPYSIEKIHDSDDSEKHPASHFSSRFRALAQTARKEFPGEIRLLRLNENQPFNAVESSFRPLKVPSVQTSTASRVARKEQDVLLVRACDYLMKTDKGCISIIGKRGRGKTSLLARIANWINESPFSYSVTALNKSAIATFYKQTNHASENNFYVAADIQRQLGHIVLVDEAANLPISILNSLIKIHDKIVFCTTVEGYESAGRAFQTRFSKAISTAFHHPLELQPYHPWRWLYNDPIEQLIDRIVLNSPCEDDLDKHTNPETISFNEIHDVHAVQISQRTLASSETLLRNVYGLLRDTHYQTNVKDLQHLLDGSDIQIWGLKQEATKSLLAVAIVSIEPAIATSLHSDIVEKKRRLPHHLLAQLLAQFANSEVPLSKQFARVTRISVKQRYRRLGLGTQLLVAIENALLQSPEKGNTVDAMGASFANDPVSAKFWRHNGYTEFHEGFRKNPRTGLPSSAVLKTTQTTLNKVLIAATNIHTDNQHWREYNDDSTTTYDSVPSDCKAESDKELLTRFVKGQRSTHDTFAAICRLMSRHQLSPERNKDQSNRAQEKTLRKQVASLLDV